MIPVKRIYPLYLQTVLIIAGPGVTIYNASNQHVHGKRHILSLKSKFLETKKNISCSINEPKQYTNTWQIIQVSNSTKRHADNSGNQADPWPLKICHNTIQEFYFLFITQNEVPFINKSEATKRSRDRKENGKCSNATNCRSRVGLTTSFCKGKSLKDMLVKAKL